MKKVGKLNDKDTVVAALIECHRMFLLQFHSFNYLLTPHIYLERD